MTRVPAGALRFAAIAAVGVAAVLVATAVARSGDEERAWIALRDADGYLAFEDGDAPKDAWPGAGVRALVGRAGRLEPGAKDASVFVRAADGTFVTRAVAWIPTEDPSVRRDFLRDAAAWTKARAQTDPGNWDPPPAAAFSWGDERPAPLPADVARDERGIARAPFVRFRSTEAAFRFSDVADQIAARLLAIAGDGRDYGTLRWALHDLTLPAVWTANPEGTRSVGDCAVLFPGGLPWRDRPQVVALLRIVDPELHAMESPAGVSYAALPQHLWKPADDPDPASRARRSVRKVEGDVELVAPDEATLEIARRIDGGRLWHDPDAHVVEAARPGADREAAFLFAPPEARRHFASETAARIDGFLRAWTEQRGWTHVWKDWTGADADAATRMPLTVAPVRPALLASLVSARVLTDAKGADFVVTFENETAARAAAAALAEAAKPFTGGAAVCARNRRDVAPLAVMDRPHSDLAERSFVVLGWKPVCPCGGTYAAHPVTRDVSCSVHGTDARPLPDPKPPKGIVRDVVAEGAVVKFRVPIAW